MDESSQSVPPFVAVGGLGGSGTRVIASILTKLNIFIGEDLNNEKDNLIFTRLFKNPQWYQRGDSSDFRMRFKLFEKIMCGIPLTKVEYGEFKKACKENKNICTPWYYRLKKHQLVPGQKWGWKEPNTHIYLDAVFSIYPEIKYIHVIRHGLDMAFSRNQQQLKNWRGVLFNLDIPDKTENGPSHQLDYWIKANSRAINIGSSHKSNQFFVCNYDKLCLDRDETIDLLIDFLGLDHSVINKSELYNLTINTTSNKRYLKHDMSVFTTEQRSLVDRINSYSGPLI